MGYIEDLIRPVETYRANGGILGDLPVSPFSSWHDEIWRFPPTTAGAKNRVLSWNFLLPDGSKFTDEQWASLLDQAKRVIWSIRMANQRGRNVKDSTLLAVFWPLKSLVRWMVKTSRKSFSELNPVACSAYIGETADWLRKRSALTDYRLAAYADVLCRIHEQSALFHELPELIMGLHPFGGASANEVALSHGPTKRDGFIPPVPDELYLAAMDKALDWIDGPARDVISTQELVLHERTKIDRFANNSYNYYVNRVLARFVFDDGGKLERPWRMSLPEATASLEMRLLVNDTRDAAVVVVQGLLGLRISEICGIPAGQMSNGALWPTCITMTPSISGLSELFHLNARVYKQQDEYDEVAWLAGSRPAGSNYIPPAVRAITVLWMLMRPWRDLAGSDDLMVSLGKSNGLPWTIENNGRVLSQNLARAQREWVEDNVDIPRSCQGWRLSTHQWRKSFAMYMVRSDPHLKPAVRDHFKHMSTAMTERGYLGRDPEMLGMLDDEATYAAAKFTFDAVYGKAGAGRMMDTVEQNAATIKALIGEDGTEEERIQRLASTFRDDGVRVWDCEWGKCFFQAHKARCHHLANGTFDLQAKRPDFGHRQPGVCCDCANLLVFNEDAEFWQARHTASLATWEANKLAGEHAAAAVVAVRMRTSATILRRLGIAVEQPSDAIFREETDLEQA
ncbi:MAG: hypothetical protein INR68_11335 [Methylobacterium mesophilicum]|nr:hypothetical protein [Methylobacterium mesophilicum]